MRYDYSNSLDVERRRPVWEVLSWLWLDTELTDEDIQRIVKILTESRYDIQEIEHIYAYEVAPVVWTNMLRAAGEWEGFDLDWLQERIIKASRHGRLFSRLFVQNVFRQYVMTRATCDDWQKIKALLKRKSGQSG